MSKQGGPKTLTPDQADISQAAVKSSTNAFRQDGPVLEQARHGASAKSPTSNGVVSLQRGNWLPKIPLYGPAAQLTYQVLLSKFGELGTGSSSSSRGPRQQPNSARVGTQRLPSIPGSPKSQPSGAAHAQRSKVLSAKPPREGIATLLYRGDHTVQLPDMDPYLDELGEGSPKRSCLDATAPWAEISEDNNEVRKNTNNTATRSSTGGTRTVSKVTNNGFIRGGQTLDFLTFADRCYSRETQLRACFRRPLKQIDEQVKRLRRWNIKEEECSGDDGDLSEEPNKMSTSLLTQFVASGLQNAPVEASIQSAIPDRHRRQSTIRRASTSDAPLGTEEEKVTTMSAAELIENRRAVAVLNLVRWLCGLPNVKVDKDRLDMCRVIAEALQPRSTDSGVTVTGAVAEIGTAIADIFGRDARSISILHGEASLPTAVEKSLAATHLVSIPGQTATRMGTAGRATAARCLANSVEIAIKPSDGRRRGFQHRQINEREQRILSINELPPALGPFRLFWELQVKAESATAADTTADSGLPNQLPNRPTLASVLQVGMDASAASARKAAGDPVAQRVSQTFHRRRSSARSKAPKEHVLPNAYGLSDIWGDRRGALRFRRCLLNPALRLFGTSRYHDTCVMWTGSRQDMFPGRTKQSPPKTPRDRPRPALHSPRVLKPGERRRAFSDSPEDDCGDFQPVSGPHALSSACEVEAVSYPPAGIVPMFLIEDGMVPWTIMPNNAKFQPTSQTKVAVWRVKIDRPREQHDCRDARAGTHKCWTAERLSEVVVRGFAVDCSLDGKPFCVIFWPDAAKNASPGDQLEVHLSGLTGECSDLFFFYEFVALEMRDRNKGLVEEAARARAIIGNAQLWESLPRPQSCAQPAVMSSTASSIKQIHRQHSRMQRIESHIEHVLLETMSHTGTTINTNNVDLQITMRSTGAAALEAHLAVIRVGAGEEVIPNAVQVQRLFHDVFLIKVKLPMARCRYELSFWASSKNEPLVMLKHPWRYSIITGDTCQTLLSSLEDPLVGLFGFARISLEAQHHGIFIVSPTSHRILIGSCYFLVYVDEEKALARAQERLNEEEAEEESMKQARNFSKRRHSALTVPRSDTQGTENLAEGQPANRIHGSRNEDNTTLFSRRLLREKTSQYGEDVAGAESMHEELQSLHKAMRDTFHLHTQDSNGNIHLDLVGQYGDSLIQLRQRTDFRGFYEALVTFTEWEVGRKLKLQVRFPQIQIEKFTPLTICEWVVCKREHFPIGF